MGDGLMEVIRFVDEKDLVRIGVREQGETNARLIPVDALAELFTYPAEKIESIIASGATSGTAVEVVRLLPPVDRFTEVWAAGVTYKRSRAAREEESDQPNAPCGDPLRSRAFRSRYLGEPDLGGRDRCHEISLKPARIASC